MSNSSCVYLARDERDGARGALRVFHGSRNTTAVAARARLEGVHAASRLRHPSILPVGALQQHDRWWVLPMAWVDALSLPQWLETKAWHPGRQLTTFLLPALAEVARALHFAHGQGVVHGNLHPGNILLARSLQHVWLCDFGTPCRSARS
jgi:serine/threonine protein kinase